MKTRQEMRDLSRASLNGKWGTAALIVLIYIVVTSGVSAIPLFGGLGSLLLLPATYGLCVAFLDLVRGNEVGIDCLYKDYNGRVWLTMLLVWLYTCLWCLLLVIPGIIKGYSYAMTPYILKDSPELENNAAIEKSMKMMKGHKLDLFILDLSFIGWYILGAIAFGIGILFVIPYHYGARAAFYESLVADNTVEVIVEE